MLSGLSLTQEWTSEKLGGQLLLWKDWRFVLDMEVDTLAARIRSARIGSGLSQTELAKALHVNRSTVGHWEREQGFSPTLDHLHTMSRVMSVSFTWLVQGVDQAPMPETGGARAALSPR